MPIYEYACRNCGYHFERMQKFSDAPVTECPQCHQEVHRLISPSVVLFNAPGFYVTENSKSGGNGKNGKASEAKSEAKPEPMPKGATCKVCA